MAATSISATAPTIYGGTEVETCGWPSTVYMDGCSGTLIHPQIVVFAAHCMFFGGGQGPDRVAFGEDIDELEREVDLASCTMFPNWNPGASVDGNDAAFCQLDEPVTDIPIVPILMGCETEQLQPGQDITLVGFGNTENDVFGIKHEVDIQINEVIGDGIEVNVGGGGTSSCNGDSGGPAFLQLDDGTWRVFGITSRGAESNCNGASIYGLIHNHVEWIENETGLDITPCHDADGTWNPSEDCTDFPLTPKVGDSDWARGCAPTQVSGPSASCGDPFGGDGGATGTGDSGGEGTTTGADSSGGETSTSGADDNNNSDSDSSTSHGSPSGSAEGGMTGSAETSGPSTPGGTGGDGSIDDDNSAGGCGCRSQAPPNPMAWFWVPLLALARRRRLRA